MIVTKGPGDATPPEPDTSCDGCGFDGCAECERFKPCSRGHKRDDGEPCKVWLQCNCGAGLCSTCEDGETCSTCGGTFHDEDASGGLDPDIESRIGGER